MVETIGKPVFHRYSGDLFGTWLQDAVDPDGEDGAKLWTVFSGQPSSLLEYRNKTMFRRGSPTRNYSLPLPCSVRCVA